MAFPPAKPSDWNQPGDERVAKEQVEQLKRREPPQEQEQLRQYVILDLEKVRQKQ